MGAYRIVRQSGDGMGVVFEAIHDRRAGCRSVLPGIDFTRPPASDSGEARRRGSSTNIVPL
jgi:hypothetical protein